MYICVWPYLVRRDFLQNQQKFAIHSFHVLDHDVIRQVVDNLLQSEPIIGPQKPPSSDGSTESGQFVDVLNHAHLQVLGAISQSDEQVFELVFIDDTKGSGFVDGVGNGGFVVGDNGVEIDEERGVSFHLHVEAYLCIVRVQIAGRF